jgi:hypothetical protein
LSEGRTNSIVNRGKRSGRGSLGRIRSYLQLARMRNETDRALREEAHTLETLNRVGTAVAAELDLERAVQVVTDAATELSGAAFGSFFYNVLDESGGRYMLYTLSGAPREAFSKFGLPPLKWSTPHVGFGRGGGPFDATEEEACA